MEHGLSWVLVLGRKDAVPEGSIVVDVTSRSKEAWTKELSPFHLGPIDLYDGHTSKTMENAWQYCKVYEQMADANQEPLPSYLAWAQSGWNNPKANRFPQGRGTKPLYSLWKGQHLGYIEARMRIYAPLYTNAVQPTKAWRRLECLP